MEKRCKAIQYSDQMRCNTCNLTWDVNDPDPPKCKSREELTLKPCGERNQGRKITPEMWQSLRDIINGKAQGKKTKDE